MLAVGDEGLGTIDARNDRHHARPRCGSPGQVGTGTGLGHADGTDGLAGDQFGQPVRFLLLIAEMGDIRRHDVGVHGQAGAQRGEAGTGGFFQHHHAVLVGHTGTTVLFFLIDREQAVVTQQVPDFTRHPRFFFPLFVVGGDFLFEETFDVVAEKFEFGRVDLAHGLRVRLFRNRAIVPVALQRSREPAVICGRRFAVIVRRCNSA
jgi:hypothetical protein